MTSSYFDYNLQLDGDHGPPLAVNWHKNKPMLGVSFKDGTVVLFQEEGEHVATCPLVRESGASTIAWHPRQMALATGWLDGVVSLWFIAEHTANEYQEKHSLPVDTLQWTADGSRLISAAADGVVLVWKWDKRAGLSPHHTFKLGSAVSHVIMHHDMNVGIGSVGNVFFAATESGAVVFADDFGNHSTAFDTSHALVAMLMHDESNTIVVITRSLVFAKWRISADGTIVPKMKVKMSSAANSAETLRAIWTLPGLLATVASESLIRFWPMNANDNYFISLASASSIGNVNLNDRIVCIAYNAKKQVLAAGTVGGAVIMWKYVGALLSSDEDDWECVLVKDVGKRVEEVSWGAGTSGMLSVHLGDDVTVLLEANMQAAVFDRAVAFQTGRNSIRVEKDGAVFILESDLRVKGIAMQGGHLATWNGKHIEIFAIQQGGFAKVDDFELDSSLVALYDQTIFAVHDSIIHCYGFSGTIKQSLPFSEVEGTPVFMDVCSNFMAVYTSNGMLKLFDVGRRQVRPASLGRRFDGDDSVGEVTSVKTNADGTRVALLANIASRTGTTWPDTRLFVYEVDQDRMQEHDFGPSKYPRFVTWDPHEPRLLAVEVAPMKGKLYEDPILNADGAPVNTIATLFATPDSGVKVQDTFDLAPDDDKLVAIDVPFVLVAKAVGDDGASEQWSGTHTMRDFVGMEDADEAAKAALVDFSFFLTIGNMDEAFKAVRLIQSTSVWDNMARMCVKTKRMDVAEVCLGNMGHARGAQAVRAAMNEPELEARVAMVAIQLGLLEDAERLYKECERYDLLNTLYQSSNQWEKAVETARKHDRIHLKTTFYRFGRYLEAIGDVNSAVQAYERANTHMFDVPRMLQSDLPKLEAYVNASTELPIKRWWARLAEENGAYDISLRYFEQAQDYRALVKILCNRGDFAKAVEVANFTKDPAACYHLAQQFEKEGNVGDAIHFYSFSERLNRAVQLAKKAEMDAELLNLALQSTKALMVDAAAYFEGRGLYDKAITLYDRGGQTSKAIDLCFRQEQFELLRDIASNLDSSADPALLQRCAQFFLDHDQFDKAVDLFLASGDHDRALSLCQEYRVKITDEMAEQLTPPKADDAAAKAKRVEHLTLLAEVLDRQGSYHMACKKYTQAGDKVQAMRSLLKSGDVEKIMFFTNVSKVKEVYVLAANFLQNLQWRTDDSLRKAIMQFYTRGKAYDRLARFYEACSVFEIEDCQNYVQALNALREAIRCIEKSGGDPAYMATLNTRIGWIEKFVQAREVVHESPDETVRICQELLARTDIEDAVKAGDVFGLLIQLAYAQSDAQQAYKFIQMMQSRNIPLHDYIDPAIATQVAQAVGVELDIAPPAAFAASGVVGDGDDGVDEDIAEEFDN